jgi:cobyrinic acid a,c-diamide synthase
MTDLIATHVDIAAVVAMAGAAVTADAWSPADAIGAHPGIPTLRPVVAVAAGKAFSFSYAEHTELLTAAGADVAEFEPLTDPLPAGAAALVLPGGFPEQYPAELSANAELRGQIRELATYAPVYAECAGLTYLMTDLDGHPMCDVLSGSARFTDRLTLGYRDAVAMADSTSYAVGERAVGHEFHRTTVDYAQPYPSAWAYRTGTGATVHDGAVDRGVHASYLHTHPAAQAAAVHRFVAHAATSKLAG